MNKFITATLAVALTVVAIAPAAASAQSMACPFTMTLKKGQRNSQVTALQAKLGVIQTGYFGSLTAAAVSNYQGSKGLPRVGQVGPLTRAALCMDMVGMPNTGNPAPLNPGTPVNTSGVEGSLDIKLAATPSNNASVQTSTDVPVYGLELKARVNDVVLQTLDLQAAVTLSGSSENPATLINTIKVWDGSTVLATVPVNSTTFTKDSNQVYYIRLAGINFAIPKDTTKFLTVSFSTNSIDSDRVVTLDGYNTSSVRAVSGNGISSFYSVDGTSYTRTHTFKKPGDATLTLSAATSPLRSMTSRANPTNTVEGNSVIFSVKSETGDSKILTVTATSSVSGVSASSLVYELFDGSTKLSSVTGSTTVTFDNLSLVVPKDVTKTLTVKVTYPATTTGSYIATTTVSSVVYEKPNGSSATVSTAVNGVGQYVYTKAAIITLAAAPTIRTDVQTVSGVGTSTVVATFPLNIRSEGGNTTLPVAADFTFVFSNGTNYTASSTVTGVAVSPVTIPNNDIADGSTAQVTVTVSANGTALLTSGLFNAALTSIKWNAGNGVVTQTYGLDDFKTSQAVQFNR